MITKSKFLLLILITSSVILHMSCSDSTSTEPVLNLPPSQPKINTSASTPAHLSTSTTLSPLLCWECVDPEGDLLSYDIYFGTDSVPLLVSENQYECCYNPGHLSPATTYYWQVIVKDIKANIVSSPVWSFSTYAKRRVLVDATKDGGVWWFPLYGIFDPEAWHQGKALADYIRNRGCVVDELPRGVSITDSLLQQYDMVILANSSPSTSSELKAYQNYLQRPVTLLYIAEYMRSYERKPLAELLGIKFAGIAKGYVTRFADHDITRGATPFFFNAGAVIMDTTNPNIEILGWLDKNTYVDLDNDDIHDPDEPTGMPVMGILNGYPAKIFFMGEINGLETVPQPFVENLITWAFE